MYRRFYRIEIVYNKNGSVVSRRTKIYGALVTLVDHRG